MLEVVERELTENEMIEYNRRAYDSIDQREERIEKKEKISGKVLDRIK